MCRSRNKERTLSKYGEKKKEDEVEKANAQTLRI